MLIIHNDGAVITGTNYWDSELAKEGLFYLSWNAGVGRLLVPNARRCDLREMSSAAYVIVSRGPWHERGGRDALELLFEDGSDSPYVIHLSVEQTDRMLPDGNQSRFVITVWQRDGNELQLPGRYRVVNTIPCLDPWSVQ